MPAAHMPWKTAIRRSKPSAPVRCLFEQGLLDISRYTAVPPKDPKILDLGGGHGADVDWLRTVLPKDYRVDCWDMYHRQDEIVPPYDIVLCTYVANVLPKGERAKLFYDLLAYVRGLTGNAFITVRRDGKGSGLTSTGSFQDYEVDLVKEWNSFGPYYPGVRLLHENSGFAIYQLGSYGVYPNDE